MCERCDERADWSAAAARSWHAPKHTLVLIRTRRRTFTHNAIVLHCLLGWKTHIAEPASAFVALDFASSGRAGDPTTPPSTTSFNARAARAHAELNGGTINRKHHRSPETQYDGACGNGTKRDIWWHSGRQHDGRAIMTSFQDVCAATLVRHSCDTPLLARVCVCVTRRRARRVPTDRSRVVSRRCRSLDWRRVPAQLTTRKPRSTRSPHTRAPRRFLHVAKHIEGAPLRTRASL